MAAAAAPTAPNPTGSLRTNWPEALPFRCPDGLLRYQQLGSLCRHLLRYPLETKQPAVTCATLADHHALAVTSRACDRLLGLLRVRDPAAAMTDATLICSDRGASRAVEHLICLVSRPYDPSASPTQIAAAIGSPRGTLTWEAPGGPVPVVPPPVASRARPSSEPLRPWHRSAAAHSAQSERERVLRPKVWMREARA